MAIYSRMHNGKKQWQYRTYYKAIDGSRKQKNSKWFDTKKEAVLEESVFIQRKKDEPYCNLTFKEVCDLWMEQNYRRLKPTTCYTKKVYINMLSPFHDIKIENIKSVDVDTFFESKKMQKLTYNSKKTILTNLKTIFHFAQKQLDVQNDPFKKMYPLQKPQEKPSTGLEIVTPKEFKVFFATMYDYRNGLWKEYANIFWFLYMTGTRISEASSITFKDFDGKFVHINKQYFQKLKSWQTPKTKNSIRKIAVDQKTINIIKEQYDKYSVMPRFDDSWFIFGGLKQLEPESLRRSKNIICDQLNINRFKIHSLRHSHVSNLIEAGINPYKISKRLGHSSIQITLDIYGHLLDTDERDILNAISDF